MIARRGEELSPRALRAARCVLQDGDERTYFASTWGSEDWAIGVSALLGKKKPIFAQHARRVLLIITRGVSSAEPRVGTLMSAERVAGTDRLLKVTVDLVPKVESPSRRRSRTSGISSATDAWRCSTERARRGGSRPSLECRQRSGGASVWCRGLFDETRLRLSGWRESNPHLKDGSLARCHYDTPA